MVESVRIVEPSPSQREDFQSRWKLWSTTIQEAHSLGINSAIGRNPEEAKEKAAELSPAEKAKIAWEKRFGKRGDPKTEAAIDQTVQIFEQKMSRDAEAKAKAAERQKKKRRGRRR